VAAGGHWFESLSASDGIAVVVLDWQKFHQFLLQRMTAKTAEDRLRYAKLYSHKLETGNVQQLLQLSPDKRIHAMKAISCLAKYTGTYDRWLQLSQRYGLKWTSGNEALATFERFFDDNKTLDTMIQSLRQARQVLPKAYGDTLLFCTLTGLRASECINCIKLIRNPEHFRTYYNEGRQGALSLFKDIYPQDKGRLHLDCE
jgi:hypothetical protein